MSGTFTTTAEHTLSGSTTGALSTYASGVGTTTIPGKVHIYKSDLHQATVVNGVSSDVCPWTTANISEFRFAQTLDTLIIVHEDFRPVTLVRGASHTAWTARSLDFDYVPLVNHNFDSDITVDAVDDTAGSGGDEPNDPAAPGRVIGDLDPVREQRPETGSVMARRADHRPGRRATRHPHRQGRAQHRLSYSVDHDHPPPPPWSAPPPPRPPPPVSPPE